MQLLTTDQEHKTTRARWLDLLLGHDITPCEMGTEPDGDTFMAIGMMMFQPKEFYDWVTHFAQGRRCIYITDDQVSGPPTQLRKAVSGGEVWSHFRNLDGVLGHRAAWKWADTFKRVPLTALALTNSHATLAPINRGRVLFYGSHRKHVDYWFNELVAVSPRSSKAEDKFWLDEGFNTVVPKLSLPIADSLREYGPTFTWLSGNTEGEECGAHAPTRLYEALSAGVPTLVDHRCGPRMLQESGYPVIRDIIVSGKADIDAALEHREQVWEYQRDVWLAQAKYDREQVYAFFQEQLCGSYS